MAKRKIVICGDSFCTAQHSARDHFSQVLEDKFEYQVINLARGGASMVLIGFQIEKAIECGPFAIVHNKTAPARFDFVIGQRRFRPQLGLQNFIYDNVHEQSYHSGMVGNSLSGAIYSDVAQNFMPDVEDQYCKKFFTDQQREAAKHYVTHLYNNDLKSVVDGWIHDFWTAQIVQKNIVSVPFLRTNWAKVAYDFADQHPDYPCVFHTDSNTQLILAEQIHTLLSQSS